MGRAKARPSDARRLALKQSEVNKIPNISNMTPIERYYALALKLLQRFYTAVDSNKLDEAYIYGLRFAQFSAKVLPTHGYYKVKQKNYMQLRKDNQNDLKKVIDALEQVVNLMDLEELEKQETRRREEEAMRLIKEREEQMRKEEDERAATQALLDRLNMLDKMPVPTGVHEKPPKTMEEQLAELEEEDADLALAHLPVGSGSELPMPIPYDQLHQHAATGAPPEYGSLQQQQQQQHEAGKGFDSLPPPSYNSLMQQQAPSFADYGMDSIRNLRPSSSRSLQTVPSTQEYDPERTTFINPLGKCFVCLKAT